MHPSLMHVVTAVANPIRWESRIRLARKAIESWLANGVQVTVVECAYGEWPYDLADIKGINHIPVRATTVAWNKECLLNLGISRLPVDAKYIATLDADIVFRKPTWSLDAIHQLQFYPVVQPWSDCYDLGPNGEHMQIHRSFGRQWWHGLPVVSKGNNSWRNSDGGHYPHCLPGDTAVSPGGRVLSASARPFEGNLVIIRTAAGKELACTPDHPILIDGRWVRANAVDIGDYVLSDVRGNGAKVEPDKKQAPASIEDVARAFSERSGVDRFSYPLPDDLDDNRANCKIATVWADRLLRNEINAEIAQAGGDRRFGAVHEASTFDRRGREQLLLEALSLAAPADEAASAAGSLALLRGHLRHHAGADGCADLGATLAVGAIPSVFSAPASKFVGEPLCRVPLTSIERDALADELSGVSFVHADDPRGLGRALAGQIERDEVVYVGRREFKGHVYDLKTERGYILADGIITHNSGYAWCWTRRFLDDVGGLFELGAMGSGDYHMALSLVGAGDTSLPINAGAYADYVLRWGARAVAHSSKKIGFTWGTIEHFFHGRKSSRGYETRWKMFVDNGFDPNSDLKRNSYGVLEFAGNKPELERAMHRYLVERQEDGNLL